MKKKMRVLVPKLVIDMIEQDYIFFGITKEKLCNEILFRFSLKSKFNYQEEMIFEEKEYLQFNLNKSNQRYYSQLLKEVDLINESEILRKIFLSYAILTPFLREIHLFREKILFLNLAIKEHKLLKIDSPNGIIEGKVNRIFRCQKTGYLKIETGKEEFYVGEIRIII